MDLTLLSKLKEWRTATALTEGVPVFRILPNEVLEAIAREQPTTKEELLRIKGIREKKLASYGRAILALVNAEVPGQLFASEQTQQGVAPLSVSEYLNFLNDQLAGCGARVQGEISSLDMRERVIYFSLKDSVDGSLIQCLMWKSAYELSGVPFQVGLEVILSGTPDIYKPNGRISLKVSSAEFVGEGALKIAYDKLKIKLEAEGLFASTKKRALPELPQRVGLITSKEGAAIGDFQMNLGQFGFQVRFIDSRVEGQQAVSELLSAIRSFRRHDIEVLVLLRGGGSLESLLPFNNERLVREVADFPVPVLVGVGHERDISLIGLAADAMVSTPTAAAEALNSTWQQAGWQVERHQQTLRTRFEQVLRERRSTLAGSFRFIQDQLQTIFDNFTHTEQGLRRVFVSMRGELLNRHRLLNEFPTVFTRDMKMQLLGTKRDVLSIEKALETHNPARQLRLGYSIVRSASRVVRSVSQVKKGERVEVRLEDGTFASNVTDITKEV